MRVEKRANIYGASHHKKAYEEAEENLKKFLEENPSMIDFLDDVEEYFLRQLYQ